MKIKIEEVAYHRNGSSGDGFHVVKFTSTEDRITTQMVGVCFDDDQGIKTAVFDRELLGKGTIAFMANSWRGDYFHGDLWKAIRKWEKQR